MARSIKAISSAPDSCNIARSTRIYLYFLANTSDVNRDRMTIAKFAPDMFEKLLMGKNTPGMLDQQTQECELAISKWYPYAINQHFIGIDIYHQPPEIQD